jgi:hypothetical protein
MGHDSKQAKSLEETRTALERWRRAGGGSGRPIPAELWSNAAAVARTLGVSRTARVLRVDPRKLATLVAVAEPAGFVALGALGLSEPRGASKTVLELVGRDGDRVRVEVVGDTNGDALVTLARAFWSRGA